MESMMPNTIQEPQTAEYKRPKSRIALTKAQREALLGIILSIIAQSRKIIQHF